MKQTISRDVLTLEEASDYLRLPPETIAREAAQGHIPGRCIEDAWRFLKTAIDEWLRWHDSRLLLSQQVGALSDDGTLAKLRDDIYRARKRSEVEQPVAEVRSTRNYCRFQRT